MAVENQTKLKFLENERHTKGGDKRMNDTRIDGNINNKSWNDRKRKKQEENAQRKTS